MSTYELYAVKYAERDGYGQRFYRGDPHDGPGRWISSSGPPSRRSTRSSWTAASPRRRRHGASASSSAPRPRDCARSASTCRASATSS